MTEAHVYYGGRLMPAETAQMYRDYRDACRELGDYRIRGMVHPALLAKEAREAVIAPEPAPWYASAVALPIWLALGYAVTFIAIRTLT